MENMKTLSEFNGEALFFIEFENKDGYNVREIVTKEEILSREYDIDAVYSLKTAEPTAAKFGWAEVLRLIEIEYGQYDGWANDMLDEIKDFTTEDETAKFLNALFAENPSYAEGEDALFDSDVPANAEDREDEEE